MGTEKKSMETGTYGALKNIIRNATVPKIMNESQIWQSWGDDSPGCADVL